MSLSVSSTLFNWLVDYGTLSDECGVVHGEKVLIHEQYLPKFLNGIILGQHLKNLNQLLCFVEKVSFASLLELNTESARSQNWEHINTTLRHLFNVQLPPSTLSSIISGDVSLVIKLMEELVVLVNRHVSKLVSIKFDRHVLPHRQQLSLFPQPTHSHESIEADVVADDVPLCFQSPLLDLLSSSQVKSSSVVTTSIFDLLCSCMSVSFNVSLKKAGNLLTSQRHVISSIFSIGEGSITSSISTSFSFSRWNRVEKFLNLLGTNIDVMVDLTSENIQADLPLILSVIAPSLYAPKVAQQLPNDLSEKSMEVTGQVAHNCGFLISEIIRKLLLKYPDSDGLSTFFSWLLTPSVTVMTSPDTSLLASDFVEVSGLTLLCMSAICVHQSSSTNQSLLTLIDSILSLDYDKFLYPSKNWSLRSLFPGSCAFLEFVNLLIPFISNGQNYEYFTQSSVPLSIFDYARDRVVNQFKSIKTRSSALKSISLLWRHFPESIPSSLSVVLTDLIQNVLFPTNEADLNLELVEVCLVCIFELLMFSLGNNGSINSSTSLGPFFFTNLVQCLIQFFDIGRIRSLVLNCLHKLVTAIPSLPLMTVVNSLFFARGRNPNSPLVSLEVLLVNLLVNQFRDQLSSDEIFTKFLTYFSQCLLSNSSSLLVPFGQIMFQYIIPNLNESREKIVINSFKTFFLLLREKDESSEQALIARLFPIFQVFHGLPDQGSKKGSARTLLYVAIDEYLKFLKRIDKTANSETSLSKVCSFISKSLSSPHTINQIDVTQFLTLNLSEIKSTVNLTLITFLKSETVYDDESTQDEDAEDDDVFERVPINLPSITSDSVTVPHSQLFEREVIVEWLSKPPIESTNKPLDERHEESKVLEKMRPETRIQRERSKMYMKRNQKMIEEVKNRREAQIEKENEEKRREIERRSSLKRALARIRRKRKAELEKLQNDTSSVQNDTSSVQNDEDNNGKSLKNRHSILSLFNDFEPFELTSGEFYIFVESNRKIKTKFSPLSSIFPKLTVQKISKRQSNSDDPLIIHARHHRLCQLETRLLSDLDFDCETKEVIEDNAIDIHSLDLTKTGDHSILRMLNTQLFSEISKFINEQREFRRSKIDAYSRHRSKLEAQKAEEKRRKDEEYRSELNRIKKRDLELKSQLNELSQVYSFINEFRKLDEYSCNYEEKYFKTPAEKRLSKAREMEKSRIAQKKEENNRNFELKMMEFHDNYSMRISLYQRKLAQKSKERVKKQKKKEEMKAKLIEEMKEKAKREKQQRLSKSKELQPVLMTRAEKALEHARKKRDYVNSFHVEEEEPPISKAKEMLNKTVKPKVSTWRRDQSIENLKNVMSSDNMVSSDQSQEQNFEEIKEEIEGQEDSEIEEDIKEVEEEGIVQG
ncbi:hypothetical protein P9112_009696 [Eukaryota sp. TZLM1-RC]